MNCVNPNTQQVKTMCEELSQKYGTSVIPINCLELSESDIKNIIKEVLYSFPIKEINISTAKWITSLEKGHWLRECIQCS